MLRAALGFRTARPPRVELVAQASAHVLQVVARRRPVIVAADDVHRLDRATVGVLTEIRQHRLTHDARIGYVETATRTSGTSDRTMTITIQVGPLRPATSARLLDAAFPGLAGPVREQILSAADGNPLVLVELGQSLTAGRQNGYAGMLLPSRLLETFSGPFQMLDDTARQILLLAALDTDETRPVELHTDRSPALAELMRPVIEAGIASWTAATGVQFRHPLTARAVVQRATDAELREAHRLLGESYLARPDGLERAAEHLAEAAAAPDEQVADIIDRAARSAMGRGDTLTAMGLLARAAALRARFRCGHSGVLKVRRGVRTAGPPRSSQPSIPLIAAQRIMYSDTSGSVS